MSYIGYWLLNVDFLTRDLLDVRQTDREVCVCGFVQDIGMRVWQSILRLSDSVLYVCMYVALYIYVWFYIIVGGIVIEKEKE